MTTEEAAGYQGLIDDLDREIAQIEQGFAPGERVQGAVAFLRQQREAIVTLRDRHRAAAAAKDRGNP